MKTILVRNVHTALPFGIKLLHQSGQSRDSRNGPVIQMSCPVTTVYERPCERVVFWPLRDANPFFHLYESLWMLQGRNDIAPLVKYAPNMKNYSDDGETQHGAYGYRWRKMQVVDQLAVIAEALKRNSDDRRCVLQMWDVEMDLGKNGKDLPCNVTATFQRDSEGRLDLTVFCRSNDIIWGAYGANAVHFSMLLEYMAIWIDCEIGVYRQISVNYHAYKDIFDKMLPLAGVFDFIGYVENPYLCEKQFSPRVYPVSMCSRQTHIGILDGTIAQILYYADKDLLRYNYASQFPEETFRWARNVWFVLQAHEIYRQKSEDGSHYENALRTIRGADPKCDWVVAGTEWLERRQAAWLEKQNKKEVEEV